jgi:hypothetical protein
MAILVLMMLLLGRKEELTFITKFRSTNGAGASAARPTPRYFDSFGGDDLGNFFSGADFGEVSFSPGFTRKSTMTG